MSIAGIAGSSSLFQNSVVQQTQNRFQQIQSQFQKLGQDLQSGNLTQAQSDFATLTQALPNAGKSASTATPSISATASFSNSNPVLQALQALGQDLQSGNLTAAQQDFAAIQQSAQQSQASGQSHHGHHPHHSAEANTVSPISSLQQEFSSIGQDLQSGNFASAQRAYASLQSDLKQFLPSLVPGSTSATASSATTGVSVTA
jgi:outer membrane protein assembly factor BamD (BamD/ComL family)